MEFNLHTTKKDYIDKALLILNVTLKLTKFQRAILSSLFIKDILTIDTGVREILRLELNKSKATLNNYIKKLTDSGLLVRSEDGKDLHINNDLVAAIRDQQLVFNFTIINGN